MKKFTEDELQLIAIYKTNTRRSTIQEIRDMTSYLEEDEQKLIQLSKEVLNKLEGISDDEFDELDLFPEDGKEN